MSVRPSEKPPCSPSIEDQVRQLFADLTAHKILTEVLVHVMSLELIVISRLQLLKILDMVYTEMGNTLGYDDGTVLAFGEQRDSLRVLLTSSEIDEGDVAQDVS
ncbi:hypothetical protein [Microvirga antarctica]|uniref:hypothetical protein n=1 Tax=Microvirga antarctica TaxID=2819233 RepID=UPI001B3171BD|nr:hypothetical protein [Microvirga antarctica]